MKISVKCVSGFFMSSVNLIQSHIPTVLQTEKKCAARVKMVTNGLKIAKKQINGINDPKAKTIFGKLIRYSTKKIKKQNSPSIREIGDMADCFKYVDDATKKEALLIIKNAILSNKPLRTYDAEILLDVVNTANDKYLTIGTEQVGLFKDHFASPKGSLREFKYNDKMESELKYEKL